MNHYIFSGKKILVKSDSHALPSEEVWRGLDAGGFLVDAFSEAAYAYMAAEFSDKTARVGVAELAQRALPNGFEFINVRAYFAEHDEEQGTIAARAKGLLDWREHNKFCPACGSPLFDDARLAARNCKTCGKQYFPRIEPAIIVLITKGDELLLARHRARNQNLWSCVAGFIEIGESAEHAVLREVREEVGITIKNLRYVGSQGWPFPDQLMLGWRAEYAGGEISVQEEELLEAKWFSRDALPVFPAPGSMGYRLIMGEFG